uniref:Sulfotransferase n=1 Tax=Oryza brachyantha TaxID=4533 RepID=J3MMT7_ORYBR
MVISFWHFIDRSSKYNNNTIPLPDAWESIREVAYFGSPIWEHILGYWNASKTKPDRVLFLRYEEVMRDPPRRSRSSSGCRSRTPRRKQGSPGVAELCSMEKMRATGANSAGSRQLMANEYPNEAFFRKGVVGDRHHAGDDGREPR